MRNRINAYGYTGVTFYAKAKQKVIRTGEIIIQVKGIVFSSVYRPSLIGDVLGERWLIRFDGWKKTGMQDEICTFSFACAGLRQSILPKLGLRTAAVFSA